MTARELEHTQEALSRQGRQFREAVWLACLSAAAAVCSLPASPRVAVALAAAAAMGAVIAAATRYGRGERIARLALDAGAYTIPEVAEYGRRCAAKQERDRLAAWIREVLSGGRRTDSPYLPDRVARYARDLERTAAELAAAARVRPPAAVACRRLLTNAVESPLYNPRLPAEELSVALQRIRRGIRLP
jgi:hypothetical protein